MRTDIVILAAGQGSRMKSGLPKVLHKIAGKPMLEHVILAAQKVQNSGTIHVVVGHGADQVKAALPQYPVNWVEQTQQLGTGHAVAQALPGIEGADAVLVAYGDVPLIKSSTLKLLMEACHGKDLALLTATMADPSGLGRIVRNQMGNIQAIVEHKDASLEQLAIHEVNTGIMALPGHRIGIWLNNLSDSNAQQEYYLTDTVAMAVAEGTTVVHAQPEHLTEVKGVNSRIQLAELEREYQQQQAEQFMGAGVTLMDPARVDFRGNITLGQDVTIDINVVLEGDVTIGNNVVIESGCVIRNASIGEGSTIKAHSVLDNVVVAGHCDIGPFARLRPGTELANHVRVGNFVEIKKSAIGEGSKVNHLTYVGDAEVGANVNVGAGTVTCNYDGVNKHKTVISDGAFIGTNSSLVAPVTIGEGATTAAGSTITQDVPNNELGVGRGRQRNINGWRRPVKQF
ncbi:bifunctional UDP-N-acetylglucosamine diphosphorylase/glucosamine-1-phosphate N-acetyltransferase GlmU [Candidatus Sororendozoicomonas aggregata]|uniref:bifunctional UDP-N-acetylglucosamine diphosphorylase/glucosamine-1-phosphate N-acetyltransferase GlmU n=1 Tax=Candidatus Sororendozoicomonas aggregata TaxID=3073239 RepID=UPI002ED18C1F